MTTTAKNRYFFKDNFITVILPSQKPHMCEKINGFWAVVAISQNLVRNENYSIKFKKPLFLRFLQI